MSLLLFIPVVFIRLFAGKRCLQNYFHFVTSRWARMVLWLTGSKIIVEGIDNIPSDKGFIIVSNHQGNMDIPVIMTVFPFMISFIAKKELLYAPFINIWMMVMNCLFINRKKQLQSGRKLKKRLSEVDSKPLLIFPEGTRSKSDKTGKFKTGGIRLALDTGKSILPLRISGTYKIWEESKKIMPARVKVEIGKRGREYSL